MQYNDWNAVRGYVLRWFRHLLTEEERARIDAVTRRYKREVPLQYMVATRAGLDSQTAAEVAKFHWPDGYFEFLDSVVRRVMDEYELSVCINRCPECDSVLRTPQARVCFWCGHSQYEVDPG
jgi:hypothetical protein